MSQNIRTLVIGPHPDDEVLGAGGTLLRRRAEGGEIGWILMTEMKLDQGWSKECVNQRNIEIEKVINFFGFNFMAALKFATSSLNQVPMATLVDKISEAIKHFEPQEILVPHFSDVHSDHRVTFEATSSCVKWFRQPSVKRILAYETMSETGFGLGLNLEFQPNVFVDIEKYLERKVQALNFYTSETGKHPFPRSPETLIALAALRGSGSGFKAAEAFQLLRQYE
jgi:LmbE family N-acetylglucosaminyl deacetylase